MHFLIAWNHIYHSVMRMYNTQLFYAGTIIHAVFLSVHQDTDICTEFYLRFGSVAWPLQAALFATKLYRGTGAATDELWFRKQNFINISCISVALFPGSLTDQCYIHDC